VTSIDFAREATIGSGGNPRWEVKGMILRRSVAVSLRGLPRICGVVL